MSRAYLLYYWCRNPKFGVVIPLGMAEWCIPFWVTLTLTLTSGLISRFFMLYYSLLSSNVSYARPFLWGHSSRICDISCYFFIFLIWFFFCSWCFILINKFSVMSGRFLGWTSTKQRINCLAQGRNKLPPVRLEPATSSQSLYHWATAYLVFWFGILSINCYLGYTSPLQNL